MLTGEHHCPKCTEEYEEAKLEPQFMDNPVKCAFNEVGQFKNGNNGDCAAIRLIREYTQYILQHARTTDDRQANITWDREQSVAIIPFHNTAHSNFLLVGWYKSRCDIELLQVVYDYTISPATEQDIMLFLKEHEVKFGD